VVACSRVSPQGVELGEGFVDVAVGDLFFLAHFVLDVVACLA
jgi:hypothetical protein